MIGAHPERVDWKKREMSMRILVNVGWGPDNSFRYRMLEERWWSSLSAKEDAYLGMYTRTHGWRWLKVRLAEDPKTPFEIDPVENDNNFQAWDLTLVAPQPYWMKRKLVSKWTNAGTEDDPAPHTAWDQIDKLADARGWLNALKLVADKQVGSGIIRTINRGTEPSHPLFIVSSPGRAWIQDGPAGPMIELPLLHPEDGLVLIDTDPMRRTATAATDPIDPLFYQILRNSQILDYFLHDRLRSTLPVWRRMKSRFSVPWPPKSACNIRVQHSQEGGTIACLMPQKFGMGFG